MKGGGNGKLVANLFLVRTCWNRHFFVVPGNYDLAASQSRCDKKECKGKREGITTSAKPINSESSC